MEATKYAALREAWYRTPADAEPAAVQKAEEQVARQEGAAFAQFMGAHRQLAAKVGGEQ
jgi:hypothetical protein